MTAPSPRSPSRRSQDGNPDWLVPGSRRWLTLRVVALVLALCLGVHAAEEHWVTTWGCAAQLTEPNNLPPVPLANSTLRQFVRSSIGGQRVRVRFSNAYGTDAVTLKAAHVALAAGAGSADQGDIQPATGKAITFGGAPGTVIPPGQAAYSDPLAFDLPALTNLAISTCFGDISATTISGHPGSRTTSFIVPSNAVAVATLPAASKTAHRYIISGIEVLADKSSRAVVVLGDSITDGNDRWPDQLVQRLLANTPTAGVSVVNMGIGGNAIFGGLGPAAVKRFPGDVLDQAGVRYFILFEGVNDIGGGRSSMATATNLVQAYADMATKAKARGVRAFGATITPFGGSGYSSELHEAQRQFVNAWLRTNAVFDAVIDFDAGVRDPATTRTSIRPVTGRWPTGLI